MDNNTAADMHSGDKLIVAVAAPHDTWYYSVPERLICIKSRFFSRIRVSTPRRDIVIEMPTTDHDAATAFFHWLYGQQPRTEATRESLISDYCLAATLEAPEYRNYVLTQLKLYLSYHDITELRAILQLWSDGGLPNTAFSDLCAREVAYAMEEDRLLGGHFVAMLIVVEGWGLSEELETRVKDEIERYQGELSAFGEGRLVLEPMDEVYEDLQF